MSRRLSFFISGVQKGGTTALWHFLRQHPDIGFPNIKELHFFDDESADWRTPDYEKLHQHFEPIKEKQVIGEATPIYTYWPSSIERIHAYHAGAKLIVSFRDPVERAFSHWRMMKAFGLEDLSFSEAIREGRARVNSDPSAPGHHRLFSYVERGFYSAQLHRIYRYFPAHQVFITSQENLKDRFSLTLDNICEFLGVRPFEKPVENEIIFSHDDFSEMQMEDRQYLKSLYLEDQFELARMCERSFSRT